jgi:hypothetical protein
MTPSFTSKIWNNILLLQWIISHLEYLVINIFIAKDKISFGVLK